MSVFKIYLTIVLSLFFLSGCTNEVYFEESQVQNIPIQKIQDAPVQEYTFESMFHCTNDGENIYWDDSLIEKADLESFQWIVGPNDNTPEDLNDDDFYFFKDKNAFYMSSGPFGGNHVLYRYEMENINKLFLPEGMLVHFKYINDGDFVYYLSDEGVAEKMTEADLNTFELVDADYGYARDKKHIYFHGEVLEGADVETFKGISSVYKDAQNVYYHGRALEGADAESFEAVTKENGGICYYKDRNHVYWKIQPNLKIPTMMVVVDADPETFECTEGQIRYEYDAKDKNYFYKDGIIKKAIDSNEE